MSREVTRTRILEAARELIEADGVSVPMERIAERAGISRRAVYLHFASRTELLVGLVAHVDETGSLPERAEHVWAAPTAVEALDRFISLNARYNPEIEAIARALDEARGRDQAAGEAWDDRMSGRRDACRRLARWLRDDGDLDDEWSVNDAADVLWAVTNVPAWRDLVVERGWSARRYERHIGRAIRRALLS